MCDHVSRSEYFRQRAEKERERAETVPEPLRSQHLELANIFARRADEVSRTVEIRRP